MAVTIDAETKVETIPIGETMRNAGITMGTVGAEVTKGEAKTIRGTIITAGLATTGVRKAETWSTIL